MTVFELIDAEIAKHPGPFFMKIPEEWYEPSHWWCPNGHRSKRYLKSEAKGGDVCLACFEFVRLGPPSLPGHGFGK
jgi:hypothetical protein